MISTESQHPKTPVGSWKGRWAKFDAKRSVLGDDASVRRAAQLLNRPDIHTVADWGCGMGGLKSFLRSDQDYLGIDGSDGPFVDVVADLCAFQHPADAVHMRGVLEHNPRWDQILVNAIASVSICLVVTIFTPWEPGKKSRITSLSTAPIPVLRLARGEVLSYFDGPVEETQVEVTTGFGHETQLVYWT